MRGGIVVVEWGEKALDYLPQQYYQVDFAVINESEREINISVIDHE